MLGFTSRIKVLSKFPIRSVDFHCLIRHFCTHRIKSIKGRDMQYTAQYNVSPSEIRNIGIIAHIDAGKTTVTERLLYLAGVIKHMGDVDSGTTITDFMELERERGITIQSAAITFNWLHRRINLIDTPGHVDFTLEVERCTRVLDGVISVLDASAGVQAQTITVWQQANKFHLPAVFFINKMDKKGADFNMSLSSIKTRLQIPNVTTINMPIYDDRGHFCGVIDLIRMRYLNVADGDQAQWEMFNEKNHIYDTGMLGREELLSNLADLDDSFANKLLTVSSDEGVKSDDFVEEIIKALRKATINRLTVPVACGSALRCVGSVKPLLDATVNFLPAPFERNHMVSAVFEDTFSALVFKISHDSKMGQLSFIRVYTGQLKNASTIYNANQKCTEHKIRLFIPHGDEFQPVDFIQAGSIAVIAGLEKTITGDTLIENESCAKIAVKKRHEIVKSMKTRKKHAHEPPDLFYHAVEEDYDRKDVNVKEVGKFVLLAGIETPDPVFFCSVEAPNASKFVHLEKALKEITIEDPSIRIKDDEEFGQTIIEAMGELHMQIIKDRLKRDYNLDVYMGPIQIAYRECIEHSVSQSATISEKFGEQSYRQECTISLELRPKIGNKKFSVVLAFDDPTSVPLRTDWLAAVNGGCKNALVSGPILGRPVCDVIVLLKNLVTSGNRVSPSIVAACASKCVHDALRKADVHLLEPMMLIEVTAVDPLAKAKFSKLFGEVSRRRGTTLSFLEEGEKAEITRLRALVPCAEARGMTKVIRSITSGLASIHMQVEGYKRVTKEEQEVIIKNSGLSS